MKVQGVQGIPLIALAAEYGDFEMVKCLSAAGADINAKDEVQM